MSADGRYVLSWSKDGTARVWDLEPEPHHDGLGRPRRAPAQAVFGAGGDVVASLGANGVVRVTGSAGGRARLAHRRRR